MACEGSYCVPTISAPSRVFPISNITFAGINNSTDPGIGTTAGFQAFCDNATVELGGSYNLNIQAHTSNTGLFQEYAFFDWNQNGSYVDAGEVYYLGNMPASNATDGVTLTANIAVPPTASLGTTRMRIMHYYNYTGGACQSASYGQFEDYNVTVNAPIGPCVPETLSNETTLYFDDVEFIGTLNDVTNLNNGYNSTAGSQGYQDWSGLTNSIQAQGEGINVFVETVGGRGHIKAWVDWNLDGLYDFNTEEVFDSATIGTSSTTFGFVIPPTQPLGDYTIRIRLYNSFAGTNEYFGYDFDSCEDINTNAGYTEYGETEDYTFTVIQSCPAIIDSITEGSNCGNGTVDLEAVGSTGTLLYHWYANDTDATPIASTASTSWTTPALTSSHTYYVTADNGFCESLVRTKVRAIIMPTTVLTFTPSVPEVCGEDDFIELSASASNEVAYLIDENFEDSGLSGLGVFTNNNIQDNGAAENNITNWVRRESTFIPSEQVWFPAISSGFGTNKFVMATSDAGTTNITENALESASLNTSTFTDLTLNFDMYFSRYLVNASIPENVTIEASTDGGTNWTSIQYYDDDVGYGTAFASVSLDLSAYVNEPDLRIRFRYYANYWCDGVAIDNIQLLELVI